MHSSSSSRTEIYNMIVNDASFQADEVPEEIINQFCVALIAVAVAKAESF